MSAEEGTIRCLLCRGIVTFSEKDDERYKDHLKVEHRVYFCMPWIIQKTLQENKNESAENTSEFNKFLTLKPHKEIKEVQISDSLDFIEVKEEIDNDEGDNDPNLDQSELAANLAKIKDTLIQNGVQMGLTYRDDSIVAEDDEADYSNANHFFDQNKGFGDDGMELETNGSETKKAFLLVYPGEDGKSISYRCSICTSHKYFESKSRAEQHLKTHIPLNERKRFQCPQCKDGFITAKSLERHIKLAMCQGIKIYSCTVCKQQFDNKFDLGDHKKSTHQQVRMKHNCETCGEGFRKRGALESHVRRHTSEKPFACEICHKAFKTSSYVKTHKKTQHNIDEVDLLMKTVPLHEEIGTNRPLNGLTGEEPLEEEEHSEENVNDQAMNGNYLENCVYGENGLRHGANDDHSGSEDTEDTNGGDTEETNRDTGYEAMNVHTVSDEPMEEELNIPT